MSIWNIQRLAVYVCMGIYTYMYIFIHNNMNVWMLSAKPCLNQPRQRLLPLQRRLHQKANYLQATHRTELDVHHPGDYFMYTYLYMKVCKSVQALQWNEIMCASSKCLLIYFCRICIFTHNTDIGAYNNHLNLQILQSYGTMCSSSKRLLHTTVYTSSLCVARLLFQSTHTHGITTLRAPTFIPLW